MESEPRSIRRHRWDARLAERGLTIRGQSDGFVCRATDDEVPVERLKVQFRQPQIHLPLGIHRVGDGGHRQQASTLIACPVIEVADLGV
ncbi:MAG: hypothetical protein ACJ8C4_06565 [Gemmataceae bacterium]